MASRTQSGSKFTRRILWLAAGILIVVLVYTAAWFYMAHALERRVTATVEEINGNGVRAFCEEPKAGGYPFRIGVACRSVFYEDTRDGVSVRAGTLQSAANIYRPFQVLSELEGPAAVTIPLLEPLRVRWESLRASVQLAKPLPERFSAEARTVEILAEEGMDERLATLDTLQFHARQRGADVDIALNYRNLLLAVYPSSDLPPLEGRMRATIENGLALLQGGSFDLHGQSAMIEELVIGAVGEDADLTVSGPVAVDDSGLLNARLAIQVGNPAAVARALTAAFPDARDDIMKSAAALSGLGDAPLQLQVTEGRVFIGFIPIGRIPPI